MGWLGWLETFGQDYRLQCKNIIKIEDIMSRLTKNSYRIEPAQK